MLWSSPTHRAATLPPQPTDLEHPLTVGAEEARKASTERACALNRERASTRRVLINELQSVRVPVIIRGDVRLEQHSAAYDVDHRERVRITMFPRAIFRLK